MLQPYVVFLLLNIITQILLKHHPNAQILFFVFEIIFKYEKQILLSLEIIYFNQKCIHCVYLKIKMLISHVSSFFRKVKPPKLNTPQEILYYNWAILFLYIYCILIYLLYKL